MATFADLSSNEPPITNPKEFRRVIGSLQYMTMTRPDLQVAVNKLSQFMSAPRPVHWSALRRILRFLAGTVELGILLRRAKDFGITAYYDADWGGDTIDRKSRTGFLVYFGGTLIAWLSKKQSTVARSSTEAEYRAIATTTQEIESVRATLSELGINALRPMQILSDNLGATFIGKNPIAHSKLKHVVLDLHFVREKTMNGDIIIKHIRGEDQWADILTKPLSQSPFEKLQSNLVGGPGKTTG